MLKLMELSQRHAAILGELSELGLSLARDLHAAALAAEAPAEKAQLASTFHKLSRSVRQTLALEARFKRDVDRQAREQDDLEKARQAVTVRETNRLHRTRVRAEIAPLIWTEREEEDAEELEDTLAMLLSAAELDPAFAETPIADLVARLTDDLGLNDPEPEPEILPRSPRPQTARPRSAEPVPPPPAFTPPEPPPPPEREVEAPVVYGLPGEFGPNGETGCHNSG